MHDVKRVVQGMVASWYVITFYLAAFIIFSAVSKQRRALFMASSTGGWLTVIFIAGILFFLTLDFDALFTAFNHIFFTGNTWLFRYSDTLIRLYPIVFWRDAFIYILSGNMVFGLLLGFLGRKFSKKTN
jgi:integral membrane protein (TIGR01906 family)